MVSDHRSDPVLTYLESVIPSGGSVAVDVGSGSGLYLEWLLGRGFASITGCELDAQAAERTAQRTGVEVVSADVLAWTPPQPADLITCAELIEHLPADQQGELLERMRSWLAPGGRIVLTTPQRHSLVAWVERVHARVRGREFNWWDPTHIAVRRRRDLLCLFEDAHLRVEEEAGYHLVPHLLGHMVPPLRRWHNRLHMGAAGRLSFDLVFVLSRA